MLWRACSFVLWQLAGGLLGWWGAREAGAVAGVFAGGLAWFLHDLLRGARLMRRKDCASAALMGRLERGFEANNG